MKGKIGYQKTLVFKIVTFKLLKKTSNMLTLFVKQIAVTSHQLQTLLIEGKNGDVGKRESNMNVILNIWQWVTYEI